MAAGTCTWKLETFTVSWSGLMHRNPYKLKPAFSIKNGWNVVRPHYVKRCRLQTNAKMFDRSKWTSIVVTSAFSKILVYVVHTQSHGRCFQISPLRRAYNVHKTLRFQWPETPREANTAGLQDNWRFSIFFNGSNVFLGSQFRCCVDSNLGTTNVIFLLCSIVLFPC